MSNHCLARAISDMGFYELKRQLAYKSEVMGNQIVRVSRWLPSSKTCSKCGSVKANLSLNDRIYRCDHCGTELDRDMNAAINIHTAGLAEINARGLSGSVNDSPEWLATS